MVTLATTRSGDTVVPETAVTDAQGEVQAHLTATTLGTATVVVHAGSVQATTSVAFVSGAPQMAASLFAARNGNVLADGQSTTWLDLVLNDAAGRPVPYGQVAAQSSVQSDVIAPPSGLTDGLGRWTAALTGTAAGDRTIRVTI